MSGIPTPRSGLARPTRLPAPGSLPRPAMSLGQNKRPLASSEVAGQASKKARSLSVMAPPSVKTTVPRKPNVSSTLSTRRPLATRNISSSALNKTVASSEPTAEKAKPKPKRQPWDLKGKLEDMEAKMSTTMNRVVALENQNTLLKTNVEEKEIVVVKNSEELSTRQAEVSELNTKVVELTSKLKNVEEQNEENCKKQKRTIDDLEYTKNTLERRTRALEDELNSKQAELSGLKTTVAELTASSAGIEAKLKATQMQLDTAREKVNEMTKLNTDQAEDIRIYQEKQRAFETERRQLHNTIQELKGNIRVFCRIRPLIGQEIEKYGGQINHIAVTDEKSLEIFKPVESPNSSNGNKTDQHFNFEFDHVFGHKTTQDDVFDEVSQLVQSAIDGYNVCIFAYGQTGSGKTYTMEGDESGKKVGIIPRTIQKIFEETHSLSEKGWKYKLEASFLEIYNEEIRDLLATEKGLKYDIKKVDTKTSDIYVTNLKIENVTNGENIATLLKRAQKNRSVAATNCNERSSRSHSVFMLKITGENSITSESCIGTLNLVDLAGSERLKESGSTGLRLEETKNINSSLSNLSKVIMALANHKDGKAHIPYRDSKLTYLLMNSLGGNSKTLMFVNLSPKEDSWNETLNSLRFAKRVNNCQIGTASKKVNSL